MLLSMFISFILVRRFRGKTSVALIGVTVFLISLFSAIVVLLYPLHLFSGESQYSFQSPLPSNIFSFPFHVCIRRFWGYGFFYEVEFHFVGFKIVHQFLKLFPNKMFDFIVFFGKLYPVYLLINLVGAIIGYSISKTTFIDKLLKKG